MSIISNQGLQNCKTTLIEMLYIFYLKKTMLSLSTQKNIILHKTTTYYFLSYRYIIHREEILKKNRIDVSFLHQDAEILRAIFWRAKNKYNTIILLPCI